MPTSEFSMKGKSFGINSTLNLHCCSMCMIYLILWPIKKKEKHQCYSNVVALIIKSPSTSCQVLTPWKKNDFNISYVTQFIMIKKWFGFYMFSSRKLLKNQLIWNVFGPKITCKSTTKTFILELFSYAIPFNFFF